MTTCIKCGRPIADGELFCDACSLNGAAVQPAPAPLPVGRMQTPRRPAPRQKPRPQPELSGAAKPRTGRRAAGVLAVCCVLLLLAGGFLYLTGSAKLRAQQAEIERLQAETDFYDRFAVCVNVGSAYYHRYGCADFTPQNFRIYSPKLAEASGYSPCPVCIGP